MGEKQLSLELLISELLSGTRQYGIKEVSMEQYEVVCCRLKRYADGKGVDAYSYELLDGFSEQETARCRSKEICPEYLRFIRRVIRMLRTLAETGKIDFCSSRCHKKYLVSEPVSQLIQDILDDYAQYTRFINFLGGEAFVPDDDYSIRRIAYEPYMFTDRELESFFDSVDGCVPRTSGKRQRPDLVLPPLFRMMYCCGMRPGEPLRLRCCDVDLGSGGSPRPYDLRHAFASRSIMKWIDQKLDVMVLLPFLSSYMGHSQITSTLYYVHLLPERIRKSAGIDWGQFTAVYGKAGGLDET